jgi:hypothetical protein
LAAGFAVFLAAGFAAFVVLFTFLAVLIRTSFRENRS